MIILIDKTTVIKIFQNIIKNRWRYLIKFMKWMNLCTVILFLKILLLWILHRSIHIKKIIDMYLWILFKFKISCHAPSTNIRWLLFQPSYPVVAVLGRLSGADQCRQCWDGVLHFLTVHNVDGGHHYHCGQ